MLSSCFSSFETPTVTGTRKKPNGINSQEVTGGRGERGGIIRKLFLPYLPSLL
jgi:hypothetical protein